jgi:putative hemolysin
MSLLMRVNALAILSQRANIVAFRVSKIRPIGGSYDIWGRQGYPVAQFRATPPDLDGPVWLEPLVILALVALNGMFAGAEIAVLSLRKTRLAELVEAGSAPARAVLRLRENPEGFLATVQIGITVVGATAAAFGGASLADAMAPWIATVPTLAPFAENIALALVVALVSSLSLILGELVPKSLALRNAETYALLVAPILGGLALVASPLVLALTGASNLVLRLFGDRTNFTETRLSRDEVQQIVEEAATVGSVDPEVGEIASRALDFSNLDTYTIMVPRARMVMAPIDLPVRDLAALSRRHGHARVPVWETSPDNVIGFVNVREVLAHEGEVEGLRQFLHPLPFIPDGMRAPAALRKLQAQRAHLGAVVDEVGSLVGLLTIEDLLEELVGEILSENDAPPIQLAPEPDGSWVVPGECPLHELQRDAGIELPDGDYATVAGLTLHLAGAIPAPGTVLTTDDGVTLEILDASPRRVRKVRVRRPAPALSV